MHYDGWRGGSEAERRCCSSRRHKFSSLHAHHRLAHNCLWPKRLYSHAYAHPPHTQLKIIKINIFWRRKGFILLYTSRNPPWASHGQEQSMTQGNWSRNRLEPGSWTWGQKGVLPTNLLLMTRSVCSFIEPRCLQGPWISVTNYENTAEPGDTCL